MTRRTIVCAVAGLALLAAPALAHKGNPNFQSVITSVAPEDGLRVQILNRDDGLELRNDTGKTVVVIGYNKEPYARLRPDGTVQVNELSAATYINEDRYGGVKTPDIVDSDAPPRWKTLSKTGRFEWHDHRIHWMSKNLPPPQVSDEAKRRKVFDWKVPVRVGATDGAVTGQLFWTPRDDGGGAPTGAIVALAVLLLGSALAVVVVRRRRGSEGGEETEVW